MKDDIKVGDNITVVFDIPAMELFNVYFGIVIEIDKQFIKYVPSHWIPTENSQVQTYPISSIKYAMFEHVFSINGDINVNDLPKYKSFKTNGN